ncbi:MAG TPA: DUF3667 domain-containing protein [Steroidobacteraceae bacterium]|jgi:hypothetical protein|nr:DUF3667 domain-containing protein [Steroidobacteraceae bacterium]
MSSIEPRAKQDVAPVGAVAPAPARCKNCDAVLLGRFCAHCSQAADVHVPTTRELAHDLLEGLTHSDSRLWRTLTTLWFKPGKLTKEFVAGRRVAYLPPFRLYLIVSIVFFLMASFLHMSGAAMQFDEALKPNMPPSAASKPATLRITSCADFNFDFTNRPAWKPRFQHICEAFVRDNGESWLHVALGTMSKAMFIFLPLVAFLNMLMYWWPRYRYAEHLLFFVHLHAFYFSLAIVMLALINAGDAWPRIDGITGILETILGWTIPVYTLMAMRRVFRRSWPGTVFKAVVLFFIYMIMFGLTVGAVVVYSLLQL